MAERPKLIAEALLRGRSLPPTSGAVAQALMGKPVPRPSLYSQGLLGNDVSYGLSNYPSAPQPTLSQAFGKDAYEFASGLTAPFSSLDRMGRTLLGQEGGWHGMGDMIGDANTLSGLVMTGGMAMRRPANSLGTFGGVSARTADISALEKAKTLSSKGASRDKIWNETGWFKGVDGEWRFEIPDTLSDFKDYKVPSKSPFAKEQMVYDYLTQRGYDLKKNSVTGGMVAAETDKVKPADYSAAWEHAHANADAGPEIPLGQVLSHDPLLSAYPELKSVAVTNDVPNGYGGMSWGGKVGVANSPNVDARSTLLHELQHEIQNREGFAKGSNKTTAEDLLNDAGVASNALAWRREIEAQARLNPGMRVEELEDLVRRDYTALGLKIPSARQRLMATSKNPEYSTENLEALASAIRYPGEPGLWSTSQIDDAYKRHAGEVESRNVQARRNMRPDELKAKPPWLTQDIPDNLQIVRYGSGVVAKPKLST